MRVEKIPQVELALNALHLTLYALRQKKGKSYNRLIYLTTKW